LLLIIWRWGLRGRLDQVSQQYLFTWLWCKFSQSMWLNVENMVWLMQRELHSKFQARFCH